MKHEDRKVSNYFNYFTEIEEVFIRRRGKHLWLSPIDWSLIESWKEKGIPLHIVLSVIEQSFDSHDARRPRPCINSLAYFKDRVEAQFADWLKMQHGKSFEIEITDPTGEQVASPEGTLPFSHNAILNHLSQCRAAIMKVCTKSAPGEESPFTRLLVDIAGSLKAMEEDFKGTADINIESVESSLVSLEAILNAALLDHAPADHLARHCAKAKEQLSKYQNRIEQATYEQMFNTLLIKLFREEWGLVRLSLFAL